MPLMLNESERPPPNSRGYPPHSHPRNRRTPAGPQMVSDVRQSPCFLRVTPLYGATNREYAVSRMEIVGQSDILNSSSSRFSDSAILSGITGTRRRMPWRPLSRNRNHRKSCPNQLNDCATCRITNSWRGAETGIFQRLRRYTSVTGAPSISSPFPVS